ncbi:Type I transmembrane sorting receptor [Mortierella sp. AD094]|nr:Type I transmembrane sorting receptor [Mortierella sp. AD094]
MKFTALIPLAAAVLAVVKADTTPQGTAIPLVANPNHKRDFHSAMARINKRYPQLRLGNRLKATAGTGKVPLTDVGRDSEYYGAIQVGTPGQTIHLNFDTGSSDIWFPSTICKAAACAKHTRFDYAASSTFQKDGRPWVIMYGDNSGAAGVLGSDIVNVGGISVRQTVGLSTDETAQFESSPEDGLFGLGFSSIESVKGVKTFMDNAIAANVLAKPVVSAFLPSVRRNGGRDGYYLFGGIDESRYTGSLTYVPVTKQGYWQVHISDVKVAGASVGVSSEGIIDTGTTLIIIGSAIVAQLHKSINGATYSSVEGGWLVPCSLESSTDSISFTMGGQDFQVPLADLAWSPIAVGSSTCFSGIQGGEDGLWILDDVFIKNNYCVFDHSTNPSIGIASLKY